MRIDVLTLFPEVFDAPLKAGLLGKGIEAGLLSVVATNIRDFALDPHRTVDDSPFGGGPGMVMKCEPLFAAVDSLREVNSLRRVVLLSPRGRPLDQALVKDLAQAQDMVLICGRYEGVDERVVESLADDEISIGDFVLSGGELAAAVLVETVARLQPGALGNAASAERESFAAAGQAMGGLLDWPHYTRPATFREMAVPEALLSGDHRRIEQWRQRKALEKTWRNRPDLLAGAALSPQQQQWLAEFEKEKQS